MWIQLRRPVWSRVHACPLWRCCLYSVQWLWCPCLPAQMSNSYDGFKTCIALHCPHPAHLCCNITVVGQLSGKAVKSRRSCGAPVASPNVDSWGGAGVWHMLSVKWAGAARELLCACSWMTTHLGCSVSWTLLLCLLLLQFSHSSFQLLPYSYSLLLQGCVLKENNMQWAAQGGGA